MTDFKSRAVNSSGKLSSAKTSRGEQSRLRIIKSTRLILANTDLSSLKLDLVADKSGVAKSSILWHFGSKNGLLLAVVEDIFDGMQQLIAKVSFAAPDKKERLKSAMMLVAEEMQKTPEANTLLISFIVNQTIDTTINKHIKEMYDSYRLFIKSVLTSAGVEVSDLYPSVILAFIDGAFMQWYLQPDKIELKELFVQFLDIIILE